uniref:THAP domain-containing protein 1 n=1 Tax=Amphilophus citrinellus TaxID=61819 RepID=A0A3Q0S6N0_AMPCI
RVRKCFPPPASRRDLATILSRYNRVLSFFHFPADEELRRQWIVAIRRENLAIKAHTQVCSRHFEPEDIQEPASETGRRCLKKGAVPAFCLYYRLYKIRYTQPERLSYIEGSSTSTENDLNHTSSQSN